MEQPPFETIARRLRKGKVVPFLGAGASMIGRTPEAAFNKDNPTFLPSARELAHVLATESSFPSTDPIELQDLAKVCSYFAEVSGRQTLRERLRELLNPRCQVGALHRMLAALPGPQLIVTTNYDTLIEQAFDEVNQPYDLVIYPSDSKKKDYANAVLWWRYGAEEPVPVAYNSLPVDFSTTTVIFKMHGTTLEHAPGWKNFRKAEGAPVKHTSRWDSFVITEEDYVEFLSRMTGSGAIPTQIQAQFRDRHFLFLGYGLRDWNLRVLLKNLGRHLSHHSSAVDEDEEPLPSWAIQRAPSMLERILWQRRDVKIFDIDLEEFAGRIGALAQPQSGAAHG
jgi:hypothetical protein